MRGANGGQEGDCDTSSKLTLDLLGKSLLLFI